LVSDCHQSLSAWILVHAKYESDQWFRERLQEESGERSGSNEETVGRLNGLPSSDSDKVKAKHDQSTREFTCLKVPLSEKVVSARRRLLDPSELCLKGTSTVTCKEERSLD
jgi:hypothetical protein